MTEAYELGQQAFNDPRNAGWCHNPYEIGTEDYYEWEAGYNEQWEAFIDRLDTEMYLEDARSDE